MASRGSAQGGAPKVRKVMTQAINLMFEFLKNVSCFLAKLFVLIDLSLTYYYYSKREYKYGYMRTLL